jgi:phenylpropionate dioxygenase-like ring-hydroxylating dioxygenase large terminal subunit
LGKLKRRLEDLETCNATSRADEEDRVSRDALTRVTDEDLRLVHAFFKRATEGHTEPSEEEEEALGCYEWIKEEVRSERAPANRTHRRHP